MGRYIVRVWIEDIVVEADSKEAAADKAIEMVDSGTVGISAEYSEVQQQFIDGKWVYVP